MHSHTLTHSHTPFNRTHTRTLTFCPGLFIHQLLGLLDPDSQAPASEHWGDFLDSLAQERGAASAQALLEGHLGPKRAGSVLATFRFLGATANGPMAPTLALSGSDAETGTVGGLSTFAALLESQLMLGPQERDLVVMQHEFDIYWPATGAGSTSRRSRRRSSLVALGDSTTAMASTVGLSAAIGAEIVLDGHLKNHVGVVTPMIPEIYSPALEALAQEGFSFKEDDMILP